MTTKPASTGRPTSTSQRLNRAVARVRIQMGHRTPGDRQPAAAGDALRSFRAADRLLGAHQLTGAQGGC